MLEFITESGMFKNIYFTHFLRLKKTSIRNCKINLTIHKNVYIVSNVYSIQVGLQQRVAVAKTDLFTRSENSSQNMACSKTSISHTSLDWRKRVLTTAIWTWQFKRMFKSFQTYISFNFEINRELRILEHVYSLDVRNNHRIWDAQKHLLHSLP